MSTSSLPLRAAMVPVTRQMRAYFAPVNRSSESPVVFDPAACGLFGLDSPPAPWADLGWIENFQRFQSTPTNIVRSGPKALPVGQFRGPLDVRIEFEFRQWGKLQMALAGGSEHMNVLATPAGTTPTASGGTPVPGVAVLAGSTATQLTLGAGVASGFAAGSVVAVDVDYQQQLGYVGSGIAAAYVSDPVMVNRDVNYVRRVTFNVARVAEVTTDSLMLAQPLLAGVPSGASVQTVVAFVDREGGSFFQEWSALFVAEEESGGRVCFYYPRLSADPWNGSDKASGTGTKRARENFAEIAKPLAMMSLQASFLALPYTDPNDGQTVFCYRSYFPATMAAVY
ncbi:MAG TPA: hypothetical protein VFO39_19430 [Candidatus Sulfotelmatobacter sp.]|nr:hypothetical protein [Candidatus Sulfotelmatobacter sp.]